MSFARFRSSALWPLLLLALSVAAQAHPGHDHGSGSIEPVDFFTGLAHPLGGWDHLLAMLAIGLWAAQLGGCAVWLVPVTFVSLAAVGGALGMAGAPVPMVEQGILASVFVLGLLLLTSYRLPIVLSAVLAGVFALCHGWAHGAEMPAGASGLAFGAGFLLSTAVLHAVGLGAGWLMRTSARPIWLRLAGAAVLAVGAFMALR